MVGGAVEVAEDAAAVVVVASRDPPEAGEEEGVVFLEAAVLPVEEVVAIFHVHPVDPVRRADLVRQEVRGHPVAIFRGHPEAECFERPGARAYIEPPLALKFLFFAATPHWF